MASPANLKLTDAVVRKLTLSDDMPDGKIFFDKDLPRFGVRVWRSGRKFWFCQYRFGKKTKKESFALTTEKTAEQARDIAKDILAHVRLGRDPVAERQQRQADAEDRFSLLVASYLHEKLHPIKPGKKPMRSRSYEEVKRHLETHCATFANKPIRSITKGDVADLYKDISRKSGAGAASHTWGSLRAMMDWAVRNDKLERNVAALYDGGGTNPPRDRKLSDAEIAIIWKACRDDQFGNIVKLLLLTGARRDEVGHMPIAEIDFETREWVLPEERAKNGRAHLVPLTDATLAILKKAVEAQDTFVFGYGKERGFSGWSKAKTALDKRIAAAGHKLEPWTLHDLRRTFATGLQRLKVEPHIIEACLNHAPPKLQRTYQLHDYADEKLAALKLWADHLARIVTEQPAEAAA
ncbi:integrase [Bradyrhizobium sp. JR7.2]|uniref:tyrosine-type recombinase/integrase n=1 Tax=unclassified Bradyrhizobium TaxID=2631580 RepID=UPI0033991752